MLRSRSAFTARSRSFGASARARAINSSADGICCGAAAGRASARLMGYLPDIRAHPFSASLRHGTSGIKLDTRRETGTGGSTQECTFPARVR